MFWSRLLRMVVQLPALAVEGEQLAVAGDQLEPRTAADELADFALTSEASAALAATYPRLASSLPTPSPRAGASLVRSLRSPAAAPDSGSTLAATGSLPRGAGWAAPRDVRGIWQTLYQQYLGEELDIELARTQSPSQPHPSSASRRSPESAGDTPPLMPRAAAKPPRHSSKRVTVSIAVDTADLLGSDDGCTGRRASRKRTGLRSHSKKTRTKKASRSRKRSRRARPASASAHTRPTRAERRRERDLHARPWRHNAALPRPTSALSSSGPIPATPPQRPATAAGGMSIRKAAALSRTSKMADSSTSRLNDSVTLAQFRMAIDKEALPTARAVATARTASLAAGEVAQLQFLERVTHMAAIAGSPGARTIADRLSRKRDAIPHVEVAKSFDDENPLFSETMPAFRNVTMFAGNAPDTQAKDGDNSGSNDGADVNLSASAELEGVLSRTSSSSWRRRSRVDSGSHKERALSVRFETEAFGPRAHHEAAVYFDVLRKRKQEEERATAYKRSMSARIRFEKERRERQKAEKEARRRAREERMRREKLAREMTSTIEVELQAAVIARNEVRKRKAKAKFKQVLAHWCMDHATVVRQNMVRAERPREAELRAAERRKRAEEQAKTRSRVIQRKRAEMEVVRARALEAKRRKQEEAAREAARRAFDLKVKSMRRAVFFELEERAVARREAERAAAEEAKRLAAFDAFLSRQQQAAAAVEKLRSKLQTNPQLAELEAHRPATTEERLEAVLTRIVATSEALADASGGSKPHS
ncbi:uncharacterized protein AMSG_02025 [Thecamonas trahens ATCC 50062]|uniref:Uncharacterized protein n=1 Tax=Thecamonas trahens ATCC 50062 TaxID=461836 RepID=A0A0L0DWU6_THETB|nr:hypothetical protein AMSG_02025 [Thecamonas trahens ATCC 50062]KNC56013.1 hypothetical protein AMSG_02025 [Thecamonas trahens ATCC 50062]|eukprot:XP_013761057.1 hypothetical protein AMSG_02025 [Thecamonas trahens ATCC 50062]